ncbi:hypothetical protein PHLGIDRAFT_474513 [Phlebiopsis gigantea 11061_1 CR5-6]|uniref:Uncharacterized protein n=1 Tax=Phlebiopsis gigantea (strain 11061_1 CR5-6) TaxID=745531 RepID=A0A0C3SD16_PHLG1|nr:hypothetical protein PHLGIDRAFT_474513 [Phlebiopsis gigantea 11061_1 CR5-6]
MKDMKAPIGKALVKSKNAKGKAIMKKPIIEDSDSSYEETDEDSASSTASDSSVPLRERAGLSNRGQKRAAASATDSDDSDIPLRKVPRKQSLSVPKIVCPYMLLNIPLSFKTSRIKARNLLCHGIAHLLPPNRRNYTLCSPRHRPRRCRTGEFHTLPRKHLPAYMTQPQIPSRSLLWLNLLLLPNLQGRVTEIESRRSKLSHSLSILIQTISRTLNGRSLNVRVQYNRAVRHLSLYQPLGKAGSQD